MVIDVLQAIKTELMNYKATSQIKTEMKIFPWSWPVTQELL